MEISQMQLAALLGNGVSPLEPSPVDYVFMLLTLVAVVLLVASAIVFSGNLTDDLTEDGRMSGSCSF